MLHLAIFRATGDLLIALNSNAVAMALLPVSVEVEVKMTSQAKDICNLTV